MYSSITRSIRVTVEPIFLEDQSSPSDDHYVWAYQVKIENDGGRGYEFETLIVSMKGMENAR